MATIVISQIWPGDGGETKIAIYFEDSYPLAMERAMDEALRGWLTATGADADDEI